MAVLEARSALTTDAGRTERCPVMPTPVLLRDNVRMKPHRLFGILVVCACMAVVIERRRRFCPSSDRQAHNRARRFSLLTSTHNAARQATIALR